MVGLRRRRGKFCRLRQILPAIFALTGSFFPAVSHAAANPPHLLLPLACEPGRDCWAVRFVDHDPTRGVRDYAGETRTEDGHDGTDIAIRDGAAMTRGVAVRAAASGTVARTREGEPDFLLLSKGAEAVRGRECGNGVLLRHPDGLETQYCHLRRGSVMVRVGDHVPAGAVLGFVGMSGETNFPHLHFTVRRGGATIDPFAPREGEAGWPQGLTFRLDPGSPILIDSGISPAPPDRPGMAAGHFRLRRLPATAPAIILWVRGFWFSTGDRIRFTLRGPGGDILLDRRLRIDRARPLGHYFAGRRRGAGRWPTGIYRALVTVTRSGRRIERSSELEVFPQ